MSTDHAARLHRLDYGCYHCMADLCLSFLSKMGLCGAAVRTEGIVRAWHMLLDSSAFGKLSVSIVPDKRANLRLPASVFNNCC